MTDERKVLTDNQVEELLKEPLGGFCNKCWWSGPLGKHPASCPYSPVPVGKTERLALRELKEARRIAAEAVNSFHLFHDRKHLTIEPLGECHQALCREWAQHLKERE